MKFLVVFAVLAVTTSAHLLSKRAAGDQQPKVWDALKELRGGKDLTTEEMQDLLKNAVAGSDYPNNAVIPDKKVDCKSYNQQGFYADESEPSKCQVFHRCDENGNVNSFLCPNQTLYNQITLVCDWFFNIDCSVSKKFQDYSNSRLGQENVPLLDDQLEILVATGAVDSKSAVPVAPSKAAAKPITGKKVVKPAAEGRLGRDVNATTAAPVSANVTSAATEVPAAGAMNETAVAPSATNATTEVATTVALTESAATEAPVAGETSAATTVATAAEGTNSSTSAEGAATEAPVVTTAAPAAEARAAETNATTAAIAAESTAAPLAGEVPVTTVIPGAEGLITDTTVISTSAPNATTVAAAIEGEVSAETTLAPASRK